MAELTPEQRAELLHRSEQVARYGGEPAGPVSPPRQAAPAAEAEGDLFSAADLCTYAPPAEQYVMPNGKRLWVHPASLEDGIWINQQALREVRALPPLDAQELAAQLRTRAMVYQVIAVCRKGPEANAAKVFGPDDAEPLRRNRGWVEAVQQIVSLSDRLGGEAAALEQVLVDFFGGMERWLRICAGRLSTDTLSRCSADLERCASLVSSIARRRAVSPADLMALLGLDDVTE